MCVEGGSHGGFMTGWLIGHPKYKDLWAAAGLWNAVLDMSYMVAATDIPDWIYACCQNKELDDFGSYSLEDTKDFFSKSPISQVANVTTPSLFLVETQTGECHPTNPTFTSTASRAKASTANYMITLKAATSWARQTSISTTPISISVYGWTST